MDSNTFNDVVDQMVEGLAKFDPRDQVELVNAVQRKLTDQAAERVRVMREELEALEAEKAAYEKGFKLTPVVTPEMKVEQRTEENEEQKKPYPGYQPDKTGSQPPVTWEEDNSGLSGAKTPDSL